MRFVIKDTQWEILKPLLKNDTKVGRPRTIDDRIMVEAILYIVRTGVQWRDLPKEFPNWKSVYSRFNKWNKNGTWNKIWLVLKKNWKTNVRNERYSAILQ